MVGHYLLTLTPKQEERVLTEKMVGFDPDGGFPVHDEDRCLVLVAHGESMYLPATEVTRIGNPDKPWPWMSQAYDLLCARFGDERINAAIRNRILANQARRVLAPCRREVVAQ